MLTLLSKTKASFWHPFDGFSLVSAPVPHNSQCYSYPATDTVLWRLEQQKLRRESATDNTI